MLATLMYGAGDVRVEDVPDSRIKFPTDALVRITASCVCGSDLHPLMRFAVYPDGYEIACFQHVYGRVIWPGTEVAPDSSDLGP
jgi:threonine dehydrogenase-like Zn-dependent dehydrogenase